MITVKFTEKIKYNKGSLDLPRGIREKKTYFLGIRIMKKYYDIDVDLEEQDNKETDQEQVEKEEHTKIVGFGGKK